MRLSQDRGKALLESTFKIIKERRSSGEEVLIKGFGKFCVKDKPVRKGRNPATGNELMLDARKVIVFYWSPLLKEKLNWRGGKSSADYL